ncbi:MAG: DUF1573 domain-containing protein [Bacteroidetes bacterium]|nr:DUF1573 domain-containing protein [Bacteroidota bacterium]
MTKYFLLIAVPVLLLSCDVRRKDKIGDDSKTDSLTMVQRHIEDSIKAAKQAQEQEEAMKKSTTVAIIDSVYNFGTITEGEKVQFSFRFKNTGTNPLVIFNAHGSCGCTVPEIPEKPIAPNEEGFLKVVFNSAGKKGHTEKEVTVNSNAVPGFTTLKLVGEINEK